MKLALFGATGRAGRHLLAQALQAGHQVRALVRNPAKLAGEHERLIVQQGDVLDAAAVAATILGADAVLSVLGPSTNKPLLIVTRATQNILHAMQSHRVRRLIVSAGAGVHVAHDAPGLLDTAIQLLVKTLSRHVYEDMAQMVALVQASETDWTIVRVPMLTDEPGTGQVRATYVGKGLRPRLSRADLATFMLKQAQATSFVRQAPAISN